MSRTDSTDPLAILIWYAANRADDHDHGTGPCDLPLTLADHLAGGTRCRWTFASLTRTQCFCGHQHGAWWWQDECTRNRKRVRRELDGLRRLANAGERIDDVVPTAYPRR